MAIFVVVATALGSIALYASIKVSYPNGSTPRLRGYCCGYCENSTECIRATIGADEDETIDKEYICNNRKEFENRPGRALRRVPITPVNAWTNVAYMVMAFLPFAQRVRTSSVTTLYSVFVLALGFGSGLFHAGGSATGHIADMVGVFLVFAFLAAHAIQILVRRKNDLLLVGLTVVFTIMQFYIRLYQGSMWALIVIGIIIVIPLFVRSENWNVRSKIFITMLIFAAAQVFRLLDGTFCKFLGEHTMLQAHGLWHLVSAIGIGYAFWLEQEIMEDEMVLE